MEEKKRKKLTMQSLMLCVYGEFVLPVCYVHYFFFDQIKTKPTETIQ